MNSFKEFYDRLQNDQVFAVKVNKPFLNKNFFYIVNS